MQFTKLLKFTGFAAMVGKIVIVSKAIGLSLCKSRYAKCLLKLRSGESLCTKSVIQILIIKIYKSVIHVQIRL